MAEGSEALSAVRDALGVAPPRLRTLGDPFILGLAGAPFGWAYADACWGSSLREEREEERERACEADREGVMLSPAFEPPSSWKSARHPVSARANKGEALRWYPADNVGGGAGHARPDRGGRWPRLRIPA